MLSGLRILIGSPLGRIVANAVGELYPQLTIQFASTEAEFVRAITGRARFDVVTADLIWNDPRAEWSFDGLDAIDRLHDADRLAPVILTRQGHSMETDHLEEAAARPEVWGVIEKAAGLPPLLESVRSVAFGSRRPAPAVPADDSLYRLFQGRRGNTAGRLAGAIASGRATDNASLAVVAGVSPSTANKVTSHYLGPIMITRGEHDESLPLTQGAVYRWCGLHARYLVSWCRRNGHADVLGDADVLKRRD